MLALVFTIVFSALLIVAFKVFERMQIDVFPAIVINYLTCSVIGCLVLQSKSNSFLITIAHSPWLYISTLLGLGFIITFNVISLSTLHLGISTTSVAGKLGLILPVSLGILLYHEAYSILKLAGIGFALAAVVLTSIRDDDAPSSTHSKWVYLLPFIIFFSSGLIDCTIQFAQKTFFTTGGFEGFVWVVFSTAGGIGLCILLFLLFTGKAALNWKTILGGVVLGCVNYASFYYNIAALNESGLESSALYPISNIGTVAFAIACALLLFKEKLNKLNSIGLVLAFVAILLIAFAK